MMLKEKWSCYDCIWATDKCKNKNSGNYDKFLDDIEKCNFTGDCDNSLGCSWGNLEKENNDCVARGVVEQIDERYLIISDKNKEYLTLKYKDMKKIANTEWLAGEDIRDS